MKKPTKIDSWEILKKDFERDGEILLYKGKPFTGRYPYDSDSWWDLVWDRPMKYYKEGIVIFALGRYMYITPELTEEEFDKAMKEIDKNWTGLKNWFFPITKQEKKLKEVYEIFKKSKLKK